MTEKPKRKPGRPPKAEMISQADFARMCGFNLQNINHYTGGVTPKIIVGSNGKVDIKDPVNAAFLNDRQRTETKKQLLEEAHAEANVESRIDIANVIKAEADAKWKAIKARKETGELIDRRIIEKVFLMVGRTMRELLLPQGERVSPKVCALFANVSREKMLEVQALVDDENESALEEIIGTLEKAIQEEQFFECHDDGEF